MPVTKKKTLARQPVQPAGLAARSKHGTAQRAKPEAHGSEPAAASQPRKRQGQGLRAQDPYLVREQAKYAHPLPSREFILQVLTAEGVPVLPHQLARLLQITTEEEAFFQRRLRAMEREGEIVINRKGAICVPEKLDLIKGQVQGHPDGFGFVAPEDGSEDLFLSPREMQKALHGDLVMVREVAATDRRNKREAKIVEVLERVNNRIVGRLYEEQGIWFVVAENKRINQDILVPVAGLNKAREGQVVTVELTQQPNELTQPIGRIVEVLGHYTDPGMEIEIALRKHDLPHEFSAEALAQARKTPKHVRKKDLGTDDGIPRVDLRHLPLVTIDGETARDFDDAVYAEKQGKGYRLLVAIADVSYYVRPDDALDKTALERSTSVYFPRRVIPMLPEALSNGICSLNPDVERLCLVCDMAIDLKGQIQRYQFYPAVMLSQARLTYTQVWDALTNPAGPEAEAMAAVLPHVQTLYALFKVLLGGRAERGAIDFETTETLLEFDDAGKIERIVPYARNDAHRLIEECMLAANVCAAQFLLKHEHPALYRVHDTPTPEKLENLRLFLREFNLALPGGDEPTAKDYAQLLHKIKDRPDMALLQTVLLRSMQQAVYAPDNVGHFGLAYEAYAHFTSPIRRYPDLLVHRAIKSVLRNEIYRPAMKWTALGVHCSANERRADEASRDVTNWLKCFFMRERIGEEFEGTIAGVTGFGLFVSLDEVYVEGLVHISELGSDYFKHDAARHILVGERTRKVFRLSDRVRVKVVRADLETSRIDFVLVEDAPTA
jgi:ribonuclease R